jgi:inositol phosphorylceramide mannosyltransferase catalytic subunit
VPRVILLLDPALAMEPALRRAQVGDARSQFADGLIKLRRQMNLEPPHPSRVCPGFGSKTNVEKALGSGTVYMRSGVRHGAVRARPYRDFGQVGDGTIRRRFSRVKSALGVLETEFKSAAAVADAFNLYGNPDHTSASAGLEGESGHPKPPDPTRRKTCPVSKIPKLIHQLYFPDESAAPARYRQYRQGVLASHPGWDHMFWTERTARAMLSDSHPSFLPVYDSYRYRIQRCDAFRYFLLHHYGGFYVDMDIESVRPLNGMLEEFELIFCNRACIGNAIMGSVPGHPLWPSVFEAMRERRHRPPLRIGQLLDWSQVYYVSRSTGSELLEDCVLRGGYANSETARIVPSHVLEADAHFQVGRDKLPLPGYEDIYAIHHKGMRGVPLRLRVLSRVRCTVARSVEMLKNGLTNQVGGGR